jgi:hypothetical protein
MLRPPGVALEAAAGVVALASAAAAGAGVVLESEATHLVSVQVAIRPASLTLRRLFLRMASRLDGKKVTKQVGRKRAAIVPR